MRAAPGRCESLADAPIDLGHHRVVDQGGLVGDGVRGEEADPAVPEQGRGAWQAFDELHRGGDEPGGAVPGQRHGGTDHGRGGFPRVPVSITLARESDAVVRVLQGASLGGVDQASCQIPALLPGIPPGVGIGNEDVDSRAFLEGEAGWWAQWLGRSGGGGCGAVI